MPTAGQLLVAPRIRAGMSELQKKIMALPESERHGGPILFDQLSSLADLVGEEAVLKGFAIYDGGGVHLLVEENEFAAIRQKEEESAAYEADVEDESDMKEENLSSVFSQESGEVSTTANVKALMDSLELELDIKTELSQQEPSAAKEEPMSCSSFQSVAPRKSSSATTVDLFDSQELEGQWKEEVDTEFLASILPEHNPFEEEEETSCELRFFEVSSSMQSQHTVFLIPEVNFCTCEHFQTRVLADRADFTCSHVIAAWLSVALENVKHIPTRADTLQVISRHFLDRTFDFH